MDRKEQDRVASNPSSDEATVVRPQTSTGVAGFEPRSMLGQALGDRYRLERVIGRGGMGVVYEGRDERLGREVAIKILSAQDVDQRARDRFLLESRAAAALNHPNVVSIHDAGEAGDHPYLIMEKVPGGSLADHAPSDFREIINTASQISEALEHAHARGIVHRDLKPGNVLIDDSSAGSRRFKLADLGIALTRGQPRLTRSGSMTGTPAFMAPEQALGQVIDARADLYALGVMLYLWVAGRLPFEGDDSLTVISQHIFAPVVPPRSFRPDIPPRLEAVILRLLEKNPHDRPAGAAEVRKALAEAAEGSQTAGTESGTIDYLTRGRLIGRRDELVQLQAAWRNAGRQDASLVLISGEPGIGKTRLAREIITAARLDGALVLNGGCYENEAATPYLPFLEAFRKLVRDIDDETLRETLGDAAPQIARLAPEIDSRLGPFRDQSSSDPNSDRLRLFDDTARFLSRLAGSRGLLFFIDDLQWADKGSLAMLHYLIRQLATERVLFVCTHRRAELDQLHPLSASLVEWNRERLAFQIRLDRLDHAGTSKLVGTLLSQQDPPPDLVDSLYKETEGNPFFIEEIVKALIAEGNLVREGASWKRGISEELLLPPSVKAAIGTRIAAVGRECAEVLQTAAVIGKLFDFSELASVATQSEDQLLDALDQGVRAHLIATAGGESFVFTHDKIREVLHQGLNPIRRRRLHHRIAGSLEKRADAGEDVATEEAAYHFIEAGDYAQGLIWAERAADAATRVFAWQESLDMLRQARDCAETLSSRSDSLRLDERIGDTLVASGQLVEAAATFERVLSSSNDLDAAIQLRCKAADAYVNLGDARGLAHVDTLLEAVSPETHPTATAWAMMIRARFFHLHGKPNEALEVYEPAIALAEKAGAHELLIQALGNVAGSYQHLAMFDESDRYANRSIEIARKHGIHRGEMLGLEFISENRYFAGLWDEAIRYAEEEERISLEFHAVDRYLWTHMRVFPLMAKGNIREATRIATRAIEESKRIAERRLRLFLQPGLGFCMVLLGNTDEGLRICREAVREADEHNLTAHRVHTRGHEIRSLLEIGRSEQISDQAQVAIGILKGGPSYGMAAIFGSVLAEALIATRGPRQEIVEVLDRHEEIAHRIDSPVRNAENLRVRALLAESDGEMERADQLLVRANSILEDTTSSLMLHYGLADHARVLEQLGRTGDAGFAWTAAQSLRSKFDAEETAGN